MSDDKKDKKSKNPWANAGSGTGQSGSKGADQNPSSRGQGPKAQDIDVFMRQLSDNLSQFTGGRGGRGSGNGNGAGANSGLPPYRLGALIIGVLGVLYFASGLYFLDQAEHGVIQTFGKYTNMITEPGLKYALPRPVQKVTKVNVTRVRQIKVGYRGGQDNAQIRDIEVESLMLTGDENIIDIDFVVFWKISNAADYIFQIRDPEATIKIVAESAMREVIGRTNIQPALAEAREQIQNEVKDLMQDILDEYESGVSIGNIQLQKVDPPREVIDAFNEVQRANQDKDKLRNNAIKVANDIVPNARGKAKVMILDAEAYQEQVINRAKGGAERFKSIYDAYSRAKRVTADRLYFETLEQVIGESNTIVLDGDASGAIPYLPLDRAMDKAQPKQKSSVSNR